MGQSSQWDESMEMYRVPWEWRPRFAAEEECTHGALPTDKQLPAGCLCWEDLREAA